MGGVDAMLLAVLAVLGVMCLALLLTPTPSPVVSKPYPSTSSALRLRKAGLRIIHRQFPEAVEVTDGGGNVEYLDTNTDAYWQGRGIERP